jgi:hypothetical protein
VSATGLVVPVFSVESVPLGSLAKDCSPPGAAISTNVGAVWSSKLL